MGHRPHDNFHDSVPQSYLNVFKEMSHRKRVQTYGDLSVIEVKSKVSAISVQGVLES